MGKLFGTDGVRGVANRELTPELAFRLGRAGAAVLAAGKKPRVLIGRDTRLSGEMLEAALAAGVASVGADAIRLGILPTPGVAYLVRAMGADAAAMISASHNPVPDNGIKFFAGDGFKLPDEVEEKIEDLVLAEGEDRLPRPVGVAVGRIYDEPEAWRRYAEFLQASCKESLAGLRIVVDCGFGAAFKIAPMVLRALGAEVVAINAAPDGSRINVGCGSTSPEGLRQEVLARGADLGLAHDGDADRVIAVDEEGGIVDGDRVMCICALERLARGTLPKKAIAATVYSNLGLRAAIEAAGGEVILTPNGDRYVLEAMRRHGLAIGGEQSGHIIFLEKTTTGDGLLTALELLGVLVRSGRKLSELAAQMKAYPQMLVNVPVTAKDRLAENSAVAAAVAAVEEALSGRGRILVRASGTENLVRVMAEGPDEEELRRLVDGLAAVIARELG
ncbi:MAG: phosphoglucosamine mutase [Firmicutes bacterium]|nr:phosphoglucosamine mutase [Bacillota bacterium]